MNWVSPEMLAVMGTLLSSMITAFVTYKVATTNAHKDITVRREEFVDNHMKSLIEAYQREISGLRDELAELRKENRLLREEIVDLKVKLIQWEEHEHTGGNNNV